MLSSTSHPSIVSRIRPARLWVVFLVLLVWMPNGYAEDLLQLLPVALQNDAKYMSAEQTLLADREGVDQTRADLLPNVEFGYEFKRRHSSITESDNLIADGSTSTFSTWTTSVTLTQSLFDYSRWARYSQSQITSNRAAVEFAQAKQELLLRLAESYFLVLERSDQLDTIQSEKAAMSKYLETSKKKHEIGLGRRVDMEDALARYLDALSREVELQSRLIDSQYALREVLGFVPGALASLTEDLDPVPPTPNDPQQWVDLATKLNLELQSLNLALEAAKEQVSVFQGEHMPTVDLVLTQDVVDQGGNVFGGASKSRNQEIAIQLNVPFFSSGRTSSRVRQAKFQREAAFYDRNDTRRAVVRSAQEAFNRINAAIIQIDALQQSVNAQQRLLDSKTAGYQVGQNSLLEVLDVQQDLSSAKQALTKARYDYVLNVLRLKSAAGDLQESDLAAVNNLLTGGSVPMAF